MQMEDILKKKKIKTVEKYFLFVDTIVNTMKINGVQYYLDS